GPKMTDALGKLATDAHDWQGDGYHCAVCWCSMHCSQCGTGCGGQGHYVIDADGGYFHCQEPERWQRQAASIQEHRKSHAPRSPRVEPRHRVGAPPAPARENDRRRGNVRLTPIVILATDETLAALRDYVAVTE